MHIRRCNLFRPQLVHDRRLPERSLCQHAHRVHLERSVQCAQLLRRADGPMRHRGSDPRRDLVQRRQPVHGGLSRVRARHLPRRRLRLRASERSVHRDRRPISPAPTSRSRSRARGLRS
jgi:hypothetical protein